jgi:hypothetical protein
MALWFERHDTVTPKPPAPSAEIHMNLWRHAGRGIEDKQFLDIGLRLTGAVNLAALKFFVPVVIEPAMVEDLSDCMRSRQMLSAVFNDVIDLGEHSDPNSFLTTKDRAHYLTIHAVRNPSLHTVPVGQGTIIEFDPALCEQLGTAGSHYLRFRINLGRAQAANFSSQREAGSRLINVDAVTVEFTEVRFNEFRNLPAMITDLLADPKAGRFKVTSAHCFLLRDTSFELVASHATIHKMRRLEAHLWDGYLPEAVKPRLNDMLVYHWKSVATGSGEVESFVALAKFRRINNNLLWYIVGIVLLGATGSALAATVAEKFGGNVVAGVIIVACLIALYGIFRFISWQKGRDDGTDSKVKHAANQLSTNADP